VPNGAVPNGAVPTSPQSSGAVPTSAQANGSGLNGADPVATGSAATPDAGDRTRDTGSPAPSTQQVPA
jgi:hypothetical protein